MSDKRTPEKKLSQASHRDPPRVHQEEILNHRDKRAIRKKHNRNMNQQSRSTGNENDTLSSEHGNAVRMVASSLRNMLAWGPELRMLVAGEFLFQYVRESASQLLRTGYADSLGLVPIESYYLIEIQFYIGAFFAIFIGWLADAVISQYRLMVISLLFFCIVPLFCSVASIPTVMVETRKGILMLLQYTFAVFTLAGGTRLAFLFAQDPQVEKSENFSTFIFWCIWMRYFAKLVHGLVALVPFETTYLLMNGFVISISSMVYVGTFFIMKSNMVQTPPQLSMVNNTLIYSLVAIYKTVLDMFTKKTKWLEQPHSRKEIPFNPNSPGSALTSGKQFAVLVFLFLPYIGYGSAEFLLEKVFYQQFKYLHAGKFFSLRPHYSPLEALFSSVFLLAVKYLILPLLDKVKSVHLKITQLKLMLVSYLFLGGAVIWAYIIQLDIEKINQLPSFTMAQVLIYNGIPAMLSINSSLFSAQVLKERGLFIGRLNMSLSMNLSYSYGNKKQSDVIDITTAKSMSYIITENGVRKIDGPDPIYTSPQGFNCPGMPTTFAISIDENIVGDFNIIDSTTNLYDTTVEMEYQENRKFFNIKGGRYKIRFIGYNTTENKETVSLYIGGVYSIVLFTEPNFTIEVFNLLEPAPMLPYILVPGMMLKSAAIAFGCIPLYQFTNSESPDHMTSIMMSYILFLQTMGFGIPLWTSIGYWHLLSTSHHILIHMCILFIFFFIFLVFILLFYRNAF